MSRFKQFKKPRLFAFILTFLLLSSTNYSVLAVENTPAPTDSNIAEQALSPPPESDEIIVLKAADGGAATAEDSVVTWQFEAAQGLYTVQAVYSPEVEDDTVISRSFLLNNSADSKMTGVEFPRRFVDMTDSDGNFLTDTAGNQLAPAQRQEQAIQTNYLIWRGGYQQEPLFLNLVDGQNTLTLSGESGEMILYELRLISGYSLKSYNEYIEQYADIPRAGEAFLKTMEAEKSAFKSSASLAAVSDRSSASVTPQDVSAQKINVIGGTNWRRVGESITWNVSVPETGLYALSFKARKNLSQGYVSFRRLRIDGEVPFSECDAIQFRYKHDWQTVTLGGETPWLFYLEEGERELQLEAVLGGMADILRDANESLLSLNAIYRKLLVVIGSDPDIYRDYDLDEKIPEVIEELIKERKALKNIYQKMLEISPEKGGAFGTLDLILNVTGRMADNPKSISRYFQQFKTYLGSFAAWIGTARECPLQLDAIYIHSSDARLPDSGANFFKSVLHFFKNLIYSYTIDYNAIGNLPDSPDTEEITVWMTGGRDQFQVLQSIIRGGELQEKGVSVDLKLVASGVLLKSIVAGRGPDIMLSVGSPELINYALRGAVVDLRSFDDLDKITNEFSLQTLVPLTLEGALYGLPGTMSFNVLFYRKDVLEELNLTTPKTWDDVIRVMSVLSKNNLMMGIPGGVETFYSMLAQNGGRVYNEKGTAVAFNDKTGIKIFSKWTGFFTDYGQPYQYDLQNRFRTGEMPIGIAPYSFCATLAAAAPEINGLWDFDLLPGTERGDGTIDHTSDLNISGSFILENSRKKAAAWEFLKWWSSEKTQTGYGTGIEALLGPVGRYSTANKGAMNRLSWTSAQKQILNTQLEQVLAVPEVPGGYLTPRGISYAFRSVVIRKTGPKNTLLDYVKTINNEIEAKRREFSLPQ